MKNTQEIGVGSDFTVQDGGSVFIVRAHTDECQEWVDENVGDSETQRWGNGIVVEPRFMANLVEGLEGAGFTGRNF